MYTHMKIHVYSTLAELVREEEKKENPDPITKPEQYTCMYVYVY